MKNKALLMCLLILGVQINSFGMEFSGCNIVYPATFHDLGGDNIVFNGEGYYKNTRSTFIMSDGHGSYRDLLIGKNNVSEHSYKNVDYKIYEGRSLIENSSLLMATIVMNINNKFIYIHNAKINDIKSVFDHCAEINLNLILKEYKNIYLKDSR